ncbi:MAG: acyltransferase domain-containing protein, partial [Rubripirellula sp.]
MPSSPAANSEVAPDEASLDRMPYVVPVSAKSKSSLQEIASNLKSTVAKLGDKKIEDVIHTLGTGRQQFDTRAAIVANDNTELQKHLEKLSTGKRSPLIQTGQTIQGGNPIVAGMFTGQGSQYQNMGMDLYQCSSFFRKQINKCETIIQDLRGQSLLKVIRGEAAYGSLSDTKWTQPALFSIEYAIAKWWINRGVQFDFLLGHSVGEIAAATIANVFNLESGLQLICRRSELMQALPTGGAMAVLFADGKGIAPFLEQYANQVSVAAFNGSENTTVSGTEKMVSRIVENAKENGIQSQLLDVSHAFHSPLMEPMLDEFTQFASGIAHQAPEIPIVSNLTGQVETDDIFDETYWRNHVRNSVQFSEGVDRLIEEQVNVMIETGPTGTLIGMARRCHPSHALVAIPSLKKNEMDDQFISSALAKAYVSGIKLRWEAAFDCDPKRVPLPGYPLNESSYWFRPEHATTEFLDFVLRLSHITPMLGQRRRGPDTMSFENRINSYLPSHLGDHRVRTDCVVPAAAFMDIALAAATQVFETDEISVESLQLPKALFLDTRQKTIITQLSGNSTTRKKLEIYSRPSDADESEAWELNAVASVAANQNTNLHPPQSGDHVIASKIRELDSTEFYELVTDRGLNYGPQYQVIDRLYRNEDSAFAETELTEKVLAEQHEYILHPAVGDGCLQTMTGVVPLEKDGSYCPDLYLPVGVRKLTRYAPITDNVRYLAKRTSPDEGSSPDQVEADIFIFDRNGQVLVALEGVRIQKVSSAQRELSNSPEDWLYHVDWQLLDRQLLDRQPLDRQPLDRQPLDNASTHANPQDTTKSKPKTTDHWLLVGHDSKFIKELEGCIQSAAHDSAATTDTEKAVGTITRLELSTKHTDAVSTTQPSANHSVDTRDPAKVREWLHQWCSKHQQANSHFKIVISHALVESAPLDQTSLHIANQHLCDTFRLLAELMWIEFGNSIQIWVLSQGGRNVLDSDKVDPRTSGVYGLAQVAAQEMRLQNLRTVDLQLDATAEQSAVELLTAMECTGSEPALALRNGQCWVPRLVPAPDALSRETFSATVPADSPYQLRLGADDTIDGLRYQRLTRKSPEAGQIEIEVHAAGLNFSDVLKALGLYPGITDDIVPLGLECSGVISAVGPGVTRWSVGDEVMAVVPYGFASHCITSEDGAIHKPDTLDHEDAAAIPLAFLTAEYCLRKVADLEAGERVLIHAGAGGVGLAAIQIAKSIGAEIFA